MRAVVFDGAIHYRTDLPEPEPAAGEARIGVRLAGICGTDRELTRGYRGFSGIPGHEFVGVVEHCERKEWIGRRVVGEINVPCGACADCRAGRQRQCPARTVLGIAGRDGCMAERCRLPVALLHPVPETWSDERALFVEPVSAACRILEQVQPKASDRVAVLGDGPMGVLCAWVLHTVCGRVLLAGRHDEKLQRAAWRGLETVREIPRSRRPFDLVVDATGCASGLSDALSLCRAGGTVVLKTTVAGDRSVPLNEVVVREVSLVGSRCGRFEHGIERLRSHPDMPVERLITHRFPLEKAAEAFAAADEGRAMKVVLSFDR